MDYDVTLLIDLIDDAMELWWHSGKPQIDSIESGNPYAKYCVFADTKMTYNPALEFGTIVIRERA